MKNKTVRIIQPKTHYTLDQINNPITRKRVCAYVRVSTDNIEQKTSYEAQLDEYTQRITKNPDWIFEGIYADEGISGTSTKNRKQFNLMVDNARAGQIDIILTKSISRFARNTVDALNYIRELRQINVEIIFEKENISSLDPKVEFLLTIMSSIAQEEARNVSENVKWNVQRRFREGVPIINHQRFLGYTKDKKGGNLVVVPEEAQIIKLIFNLYISGVGPAKIAEQLVEMGAKTGAGNTEWRLSTITTILKNEKYMGDMLQQKTISIDYLSHARVKNTNHAPTYYTENSHEAIIDRETYELAQRIRKDRAKVRIGEDKNLSKYSRTYPLTAMIICSECGRTLKRRYWNYGKPSQRVMQQCGSYIEGKANCNAKASHQDLIEATTIHMLNKVFLKDLDIMSTIQRVIKSTINVDDVESIIEKLTLERDENEIALSNLIDTKVKTPDIPESIFNAKYREYSDRLKVLTAEINKLELEHVKNYDTKKRMDKINEILGKKNLVIDELDSEILSTFIYKMISVSPNEIVYCIAGTKNYSDNEFKERRFEFLKTEPIIVETYHTPDGLAKMLYRVVVI